MAAADDGFSAVLAKFLPRGLDAPPASRRGADDVAPSPDYATPARGTPPKRRAPRVVESADYGGSVDYAPASSRLGSLGVVVESPRSPPASPPRGDLYDEDRKSVV